MAILEFLLIVAISGAIGYVTNVIAVKCLFRPLEPVRILGIEFQGLLPKRRDEVAKDLGTIVAREFLTDESLMAGLIGAEDEERLRLYVTRKIQGVLYEKMYRLPRAIQGAVYGAVEDKLKEQAPQIFSEVRSLLEGKVRDGIDVEGLVAEKIRALDLLELEAMVFRISGKELKHIEVLGLIMGLIIGVIQGVISVFLF